MGPDLVRDWFLAKIPRGTRTVGFCPDSSNFVFQLASLSFVVRPSVCGLHLTWRIFLLLHTGHSVFWVALWTGAKLTVRVVSRRCTWQLHRFLGSLESELSSRRTFGSSHRGVLCLSGDIGSFLWCSGRVVRNLGSPAGALPLVEASL